MRLHTETTDTLKGFPQGGATSPLLSIMVLNTLNPTPLPPHCNLLMYADDGLVYSDQAFKEEVVSEHFKGLGIEIAPEKSG